MRISADNNFLFSAARDGTLMIHEIKDKDPRGLLRKQEHPNFSEEILTEKTEMDTFDSYIDSL